jgi:ribosome-associated protein
MPTPRKKSPEDTARNLLKLVCRTLDDKKAEDLVVLDVSKQSSITNYLILATGTSQPHLRALRIELDRLMKETGTTVVGVDSGDASGWTVIDTFDVMIHVLTPEHRAKYRLETLWGDAEPVNVKRLLATPKTPKASKKKKA